MAHNGTMVVSFLALMVAACGQSRVAMQEPPDQGALAGSAAPASTAVQPGGGAESQTMSRPVPVGNESPGEPDDGASPTLPPTAEPPALPVAVCDGSQGLRLHYFTGPGFLPGHWQFVMPFGEQFFAIDGQCNFYVSEGFDSGIMTGVLSQDDARALGSDLSFGSLAQWDQDFTSQCPDFGGPVLNDGAVLLLCGCPCADDERPGFPAAMQAAQDWLQSLLDLGAPWDGAVRVVAQPLPSDAEADSGTLPRWPLALDPAELAPVGEHGWAVDEGMAFEGDDARQLRELQIAGAAARTDPYGDWFPVQTESGHRYAVTMRDELPVDVQRAFAAFPGNSSAYR